MAIHEQKIGFIGLGAMGLGMASQCIKKGFKLLVYDIRKEPVKQLVSEGAIEANSIKDLARKCRTIVTVLPSGKEVEEVVLGKDGLFNIAKPETLLIELSTISPSMTDRVHQIAKQRNYRALDAPIGRLAWHARRGESLFMVGGKKKDFKEATPLLKAMGTTIHYCGKGGTGIRTKLVNNYLAIILCQLNAEALTLSQSFGLDLNTTLDVIHGTTATNGQLKINWPNKVLAGDTRPGFTIDLARKDLSLILEAASEEKVPVPVAAIARELFSIASAQGYGAQDFSSMADVLCDLAKIKRPRK